MVVENPQARVSTAANLDTALKAAANAKFRCERPYTIWVENSASIKLDTLANSAADAPQALLQIPACVTLASGRSATIMGGLLHLDSFPPNQDYALALGNAARVSGLRLQGPYGGAESATPLKGAILIQGIGQATIDNNEIYDWPLAAVDVLGATNDRDSAQQIEIRENFIHDNVVCGEGYGVAVGRGGYAYIDDNLFDFNRHAVSDDGCVAGQGDCLGNTGYIATDNFVLSGGRTCPSGGILGSWASYYNQHFDVHGLGPGCGSVDHCGGVAGEYFDIRYNAIRGDQTYDNVGPLGATRPAFELRGTPTMVAYFRDNAVAHDKQGDAVRTPPGPPIFFQSHLVISDIQYNADTSSQLAVGDFDGDGIADVFQATGETWVYAPGGQREWRYLNRSSIRAPALAFGDFDGDGKTDVFTQEGDRWLVSYGGTGPWTPLPAGSSIAMSNYGFADVDGDGKTDIVESNGKEWLYSSGGATPWKHLNYSKLGIKDVRFGHFNPADRRKTDVFAIVNGQWSVSYGGTSPWQRLNAKLIGGIGDLIFGDFNGDGITDIVFGIGGPDRNSSNPTRTAPASTTWWVSWSGRGPLVPFFTRTPPPGDIYPSLSQSLVGDFNGDRRDDIMDQETASDGRVYFFWSNSGTAPFVQRSLYTVR